MMRAQERLDVQTGLLYFLTIINVAVWYDWATGNTSLLKPALWTVPVLFIVVFAKYRKHAVFGALVILGVWTPIRATIGGNPTIGLLIGVPALLLAVLVRVLFPDKKNMDWLYEDPPLGEGLFTQLDLTTKVKHKAGEDETDSG